jgi:3',5'-cyclic AMP phosphodiesterase CpdA
MNPAAVALARVASLAARVEPELLRSLRVELFPGFDSAAEADVWWSNIVDVRSPTGIRLSEQALADLRSSLADDPTQAAAARAVIERVHVDAPDVVKLEESLVYQTIGPKDMARVDRELGRALGTMLEEPGRRDELAAWAVGALSRLPIAVRELPSFWSVLFVANAQQRGSVSISGSPPAGALTQARQLMPSVVAGAGLVELEAVRRGDTLWIRRVREVVSESESSALAILVPRVEPLIVEVSATGVALAAVARDGWTSISVGGATLRLRAMDGREYELVEVAVPAVAAETDEDWGALCRVFHDDREVAVGYSVASDIVATVGDLGPPGATLRISVDPGPDGAPRVVDAEILTPGAMDQVGLLWIGPQVATWTPFALASTDSSHSRAFRALLPDHSVVSGRFRSSSDPLGTLAFDAQPPPLVRGAPIVEGHAVLAHVTGVSTIGTGFHCRASLVQTALDGVAGLVRAFRLAEAFGSLTNESSVASLRESLRAPPAPLEGDVRRLWSSARPHRRWVALALIAVHRIQPCQDIVSLALKRSSRGSVEHAEAERADAALHENEASHSASATNRDEPPRPPSHSISNGFAWVLLSDLRASSKGEEPPFVEIQDDLQRVEVQSGPIDALLVAGDLTQDGTNADLKTAQKWLTQLVGSSSREVPFVLAVPGNCDCNRASVRQNAKRFAPYARNWHVDARLRDAFFEDQDDPFRRFVEEAFAVFRETFDPLSVREAVYTAGLLPGDFVMSLRRGSIRVGVVGLNSAFLAATGEDEAPMALDPRQLVRLCGPDPGAWAREHDMTILVTHHSPRQLHPNSRLLLETQIAPAGRFDLHVFGQEADKTRNDRSLDDSRQYEWQAASITPRADKANKVVRDVGYAVGKFEVITRARRLSLWPRRGERKGFGPDVGVGLDDSGAIARDLPAVRIEAPPFDRLGSIYVERAADATALSALRSRRSCTVTAPCGSGKTAFLARLRDRLAKDSVRVVFVSALGARADSSRELAASIHAQLGLSPEDSIRPKRVTDLVRWLGRVLRTRPVGQVVLLLDDAHDLGSVGATNLLDGLSGGELSERLVFCLTSGTPLRGGSPELLSLPDFSRAELEGYRPALEHIGLRPDALLDAVFDWTSGEPWCTTALTRGLDQVTDATPASLIDRQARSLISTAKDPLHVGRLSRGSLEVYRSLLGPAFAGTRRRLRTTSTELVRVGLARSTPDGELHVRSRVDAEIYDEAWVERRLASPADEEDVDAGDDSDATYDDGDDEQEE